MKSKSVGLVILLWIETIVSIRVLLFSIPVLISKSTSNTLDLNMLNDRFIAVMTIVAVVYVLVGIISILGSGLWKILHFCALIVALAVNVGIAAVLGAAEPAAAGNFYAPAAMAGVFTALAIFLGAKSK